MRTQNSTIPMPLLATHSLKRRTGIARKGHHKIAWNKIKARSKVLIKEGNDKENQIWKLETCSHSGNLGWLRRKQPVSYCSSERFRVFLMKLVVLNIQLIGKGIIVHASSKENENFLVSFVFVMTSG